MISRSSWCAQMPRCVVLRTAPRAGDPSGMKISAPSALRRRSSSFRFIGGLVSRSGRRKAGRGDGLADAAVRLVGQMHLDPVGDVGCFGEQNFIRLLENDRAPFAGGDAP